MGEVKFFDEADAFLGVVGSLYEAEEARHNLMLGLALRLCSVPEGQTEKPLMAVVAGRDGSVLCSALRTPPYPLLVQCEQDNTTAIADLVEALIQRGESLPGVNGVAAASEAFAKAWAERTGQAARLHKHLRVYQLDRLQPPREPGGAMRPGRPDEAEKVASMLTAMQLETGVEAHDPWSVKRVLSAMQAGAVYVWEGDSKLVSLTMTMRPTRRGICISGVYTPPDIRGRGFASALVAAVSERVLQQGRELVYLFTDMANPTSNAIYQQIGYQPVCDYHQYEFVG